MAKQINSKIPKIRFKGYERDWEEEPILTRIANIIDFRGRTPKKLGLDWSPSGYLALSALNVKDGYIDRNADAHYGDEELYTKWMKGNELRCNQVLFTTEAPMGNVAQIPDTQKYILSQRTIAFVTNTTRLSEDYLAILLKSPNVFSALSARSSGGTAKGISQRSLSSLLVHVCDELTEQTKIGKHFRELDRLIGLHQREQNKLEKLKKSMLQKMFPQPGAATPEIRFKGFSDLWESIEMEKLGQPYSGLFGKTKKDFGNGDGCFVTYMGVFSNTVSDLTMTEPIEIDTNQNEVRKGDVFFTISSETPNEVGMSSVWSGETNNVYLNSFCFGFRPLPNLHSDFLAYVLRADAFRKRICVLAQGISRYNISKAKVMKIPVSIPPDPEEQQKVGTYFRTLDDLISKHGTQIQKLKQIKSACLEKMFV